MIQGRRGLGLALKAGERLRVAGDVFREKFEGDEAMQARVFSLIDHAHAATAEFFDDAVVRDGLADHCKLSGPFRVASSYGCAGGPSTNGAPVPRNPGDGQTARAALATGVAR